jgi:GNAT superfamily N-acetyltransferase
VPAGVRIEPLSERQLDALLPMIAAYQRFYEVEDIDGERNRSFFSRFLAPGEGGMLLGAWRGEELVGYACLYWVFNSLLAAETVLMSDLYVAKDRRREGIGRALIEASAAVARRRGAPQLEWVTAPENKTARRLYDSMSTDHGGLVEYELRLTEAGGPARPSRARCWSRFARMARARLSGAR